MGLKIKKDHLGVVFCLMPVFRRKTIVYLLLEGFDFFHLVTASDRDYYGS